MDRRAFVRAMVAAGTAPASLDSDRLIAGLRRSGVWAARLDDPAYGGRGDGSTINDQPLLQALADMPPEGGTLTIPAAGPWLFDAVDLAQVGRRGVTLIATGATLVKSPRTATHMFRDAAGLSHGLTVVGGAFDLRAASFRRGQTVSAFFLVRADDVSFLDVAVHDGVEEGLKLYTPRRLRIEGGRFERLINNGVQIHAPAADGYTGDAPERDTEDVWVSDAAFRDVDDGLKGAEGQGVSVSGASPFRTARRVRVVRCTFERCVRGAWAEFNQEERPGIGIRFEDNLVRESVCHGLGLVGVSGGGMSGNRVLDTGSIRPGPETAASEVVGLVLSGSARTRGESLIVEDNQVVERRARAAARMQYGMAVRWQKGLLARRNRVDGATVRELDVDHETVRASTIEEPS